MNKIDTLIKAGWIIPVEPADTVLEQHAIAVQHGRIIDILPAEDAMDQYEAETVHDLPGHVLTPGLINAHTHASMSLFRGLADDLPLMEWLQEHIWPAESRFVDPAFVRDGTQLAIAEMLRSGTTCFNDMYFYPDIAAQTAMDCGMRAVIGLIVLDFPTCWANNSDEYIEKGLAIHDRFRDEDLINLAFAPHAPYTVSDEPLLHLQTLANELDIPIHMHVHEIQDEIKQSQKNFGMRPLERLQKLGLLTPGLIAVHMTQLAQEEISMVAEHGIQVVHCPESNLKLASGFCPVHELQQAGINVALGTDGAASNNDLDMCSEIRTAALLAKAVAQDPSALPAFRAIEMATLNGARALGLEHETGSLKPGKAADIAAFDFSNIEMQPVYNPASHLAYAISRDKVSDVWVNGQHLLNQRQLTTIDEKELLSRAQHWQEKIQKT